MFLAVNSQPKVQTILGSVCNRPKPKPITEMGKPEPKPKFENLLFSVLGKYRFRFFPVITFRLTGFFRFRFSIVKRYMKNCPHAPKQPRMAQNCIKPVLNCSERLKLGQERLSYSICSIILKLIFRTFLPFWAGIEGWEQFWPVISSGGML